MTLVSKVSSFSYRRRENCFSTNSHLSYNFHIVLPQQLYFMAVRILFKNLIFSLFLLSIAVLAAANLLLLKLLFGILHAVALALGMAMSDK